MMEMLIIPVTLCIILYMGHYVPGFINYFIREQKRKAVKKERPLTNKEYIERL